MMMKTVKQISVAIGFFSLVALAVVLACKIAGLLPIEYGAPVGGILFAAIVFGVVEVLERS